MSVEEQHVALPKLYGAPAYARPAAMVEPAPRPFDRDELPLEAVMTDEERDIAEELASRPYGSGPRQPQVQMAVQAGGSPADRRSPVPAELDHGPTQEGRLTDRCRPGAHRAGCSIAAGE